MVERGCWKEVRFADLVSFSWMDGLFGCLGFFGRQMGLELGREWEDIRR